MTRSLRPRSAPMETDDEVRASRLVGRALLVMYGPWDLVARLFAVGGDRD